VRPLASIDVGSNTIRLLIGKIDDNRIIDVISERRITRLGNRIHETKRLQDENISASIEALKEFSSIISRYGVAYVRAVATSALREAYNSDTFIQRVFDDTGILIQVISGEKEAELTLKGILSSLPEPSSSAHQSLLIVDIGGGSTECILYGDRHPIDIVSIPIGVIRLTGDFIKTDPVSEDDVTALNNKIASYLNSLNIRLGQHIKKDTRFIGTAGTFTTIASIDLGLETYSREKIHLHIVPLNRLQDMSKKLLRLPLDERKKVRGLEPGRADLIIPGIQFTIKLMDFFMFNELTISDYGLLEGVLLELLKEINDKNISETGEP
jgi:exopolyphosphatase/guanosine-5'-triphosphate,3'-diphosphate pyrophosphatase